MFDWETIADYYRRQRVLKAQQKYWKDLAEKLQREAAFRQQQRERSEAYAEKMRKTLGLPRTSPLTGNYLPPKDNAGALSGAKRKKLFKRDMYRCQICGRKFPEWQLQPNHIDHDRTHNAMSNLETTCGGCNQQEGKIYAKLLREAGPRSEILEPERLRIVERARIIVKKWAKGC